MDTIVILAIGISLGFFLSGLVGFGAALVAIPIIMTVWPLPQAVALVSIFFFLFSGVLMAENWHKIHGKEILILAPWAILGMGIGVWLLSYGSPIMLKKALGLFTIAYVIYSFVQEKKIAIFAKMGFFFGFVGGIFSGLFSSGGPLYITFLHSRIHTAKALRATIIGTGFTDILRVPFLAYTGVLTTDIVFTAIYIVPFFILAIFIGHKLHYKVNEEIAKNIALGVLFLVGLSLTFR